MAAFFFLQFGMNVAGGPYQAVIADYIPAGRRGMASSWMSAYQSFGNVAGLLVAGFVHDLRLVAVALAAPLAATGARHDRSDAGFALSSSAAKRARCVCVGRSARCCFRAD